ncbi:putative plant self-incompatibility S1 [Helianthus annuus]|nr:putative plant self-incompatibility S1 [Helianthus annuus]
MTLLNVIVKESWFLSSHAMHKFFPFLILWSLIVSITHGCFLTVPWSVYVLSNIPGDIVAHIKSGDDDLGNHTIPFKGNYNWSFCSRGDHRTLFYSYFWWGSKFQSLDLFNKELENHCSLNKAGRQHCYWWVRPDGFFVSPLNNTFSDFYWKFIKPWD